MRQIDVRAAHQQGARQLRVDAGQSSGVFHTFQHFSEVFSAGGCVDNFKSRKPSEEKGLCASNSRFRNQSVPKHG